MMTSISSMLKITRKKRTSSVKNFVPELDSEKSSEEKTNPGVMINDKTSGNINLKKDIRTNTVRMARKKNCSMGDTNLTENVASCASTVEAISPLSNRPFLTDISSRRIPFLYTASALAFSSEGNCSLRLCRGMVKLESAVVWSHMTSSTNKAEFPGRLIESSVSGNSSRSTTTFAKSGESYQCCPASRTIAES